MNLVLLTMLLIFVVLVLKGYLVPHGFAENRERRREERAKIKPRGVVAGAFWEAAQPSMATRAADAAIAAIATHGVDEVSGAACDLTLAEAYDERWRWERKHDDILAELPDDVRRALAPSKFKDTKGHFSAGAEHDATHPSSTMAATMVATNIVDHAGNHVRTDWVPEGQPKPTAYLKHIEETEDELALSKWAERFAAGGLVPPAGHRGPPPVGINSRRALRTQQAARHRREPSREEYEARKKALDGDWDWEREVELATIAQRYKGEFLHYKRVDGELHAVYRKDDQIYALRV